MSADTEPKWYRDMVKAQENNDYVYSPDGPYQFHDPEPNGISLNSGGDEMIRCTKDGFWVRGVKVKQDDKEAEVVYNAFKQWLTWAQLNKDYS